MYTYTCTCTCICVVDLYILPLSLSISLSHTHTHTHSHSAHILPLLLNLLESRELHVRMILLSHLPSFAAIIPQHELLATVLPEVLVGLKDARGEVVSATLHTLAELVPLLGPEAVIGTSRQHIFTDSQPRVRCALIGECGGGRGRVGEAGGVVLVCECVLWRMLNSEKGKAKLFQDNSDLRRRR